MNSGSTMAASMGAGVMRAAASPFTVSQWQELEHQALIYKYLIAGLPVPPELVLPIQRSFESMSSRFYHHPTMGYCSLYGKKVDPEPGRCRRTDGKKWRCSKEAYPDSKYCERHMHRGRNRSRKPVESPQNISLSTSSSSSVTTTMPTGGGGSSSSAGGGGGSSSASGRLLTAGASFQNLPFHAFGSSQATAPASASSSAIHQAQFHLDSIPYAIPNKDYRYLHGLKPELVGHNYFSEASGSNRGLLMESNMDNVQPLMPSRVSSFPPLKPLESSLLHGDYHQHSSVASGFASEGHGKQDGQSLRPFFNEWPKARDSWSGLEDDRSNNTSFSTTQLSISIPMPPSDFSTSSQSPP